MELSWGFTKLLVFPLYSAAILAILLTIFYRIEVGILFILPFIPHQNILDYVSSLPLGKDINDLLFIALIIRWVIDKRKADKSLFVKTPLNLPIFLFIIWTFIEVWWGAHYFEDPLPLSLGDIRVVYWKNLIRIPLIYLIIVNNIKNHNHVKVILLLMVVAIILLDRSFYNIVRYKDFSHYNEVEKVGSMAKLGSNELAVCLSMYIIVFVSFFSQIRNIRIKLALSGPIWITYYCIAFLFSRSGYLAAVVGWATLGLLKDRKILIVLFLIIIAWQSLLPVAVKERIEMTKTEDGYDRTSIQRLEFWKFGLDIISSSPILGAGIFAASRFNITADDNEDRVWHSFHNAYVQQAVETGVVGLIIYLWMFYIMIRSGWRLLRTTDNGFEKALGLGLIACVFSCMAGNIAGSYWNYFSVMGFMYTLAAIVTIKNLKLEEHSKNSTTPFKIHEKSF